MDNYEQQIYAIKEQQANKLVNDLTSAKEKALSSLGTQQQALETQTQQQKQAANISSQLQKLNFANYMARRGQTSAGITQAAEMSRQNVLGGKISDINLARQQTLGQIEQARQQAQNEFEYGKVSGLATIEADMATKLLNYREQLRQEALAREEQLRKEELARQQDELAYQRSLSLKSSSGGISGGNVVKTDTTQPKLNKYEEIAQQIYNDVSSGLATIQQGEEGIRRLNLKYNPDGTLKKTVSKTPTTKQKSGRWWKIIKIRR